MKRLKLWSIGLLLAVAAALRGAERIAVVDLDKVFREYYKSRIAEETIRAQNESYRGYLVQLNDRREKLAEEARVAAFNSRNMALAPEEMRRARAAAARAEAALKALETELASYQESMVKSLRELERTKRAEILEDIRKCVRRRAAAEGYRYVFDASGRTLNEQPALLLYPDKCDLTAVVIEDLNRTAVKPRPAPPAAAEKTKAK